MWRSHVDWGRRSQRWRTTSQWGSSPSVFPMLAAVCENKRMQHDDVQMWYDAVLLMWFPTHWLWSLLQARTRSKQTRSVQQLYEKVPLVRLKSSCFLSALYGKCRFVVPFFTAVWSDISEYLSFDGLSSPNLKSCILLVVTFFLWGTNPLNPKTTCPSAAIQRSSLVMIILRLYFVNIF